MNKFLKLLVGMSVALLFSCSSSKSQNDSDIIPDSDIDDSESIIDDDIDSEEGSDFVDDYDEKPDHDEDADSESNDTDSDIEDPEEPDDEIFEQTEPINGYARCYDKIPAGPYEGLFADPKLESQIKKSLGYDDDYEFTQEDLEKIKEISVSFKDLRGFEKLVNLEYVKFQDTEGNIYDFTPLSNLKKLKKIRIYFRPPAELDPSEHHENMTCLDGSFSLLTTLEALEMENTHLKEVAPIEQLVNLVSLNLNFNKIEILPENIGNLEKLDFLVFVHNNVKNIEQLKSLTNLKELFFHYNYVEDIYPIKNLVDLTRLGAQGNRIKNISAVTSLVKLTYLGLDNNQIEEIPKEITNLKKLKTLELDYNNICNLPDLKGLDSLDEMRLSNNELNDEDWMKLDGLEHVWSLSVALNKITKVPIMKNLKSLKELYLNYNYITDLSGFADNESFPALKRLDVGSNNIDNAEAFRNRTGLSSLWVDKNCIKDFSPLEELKERGTHVGGMNEQLESCERTITFVEGD